MTVYPTPARLSPYKKIQFYSPVDDAYMGYDLGLARRGEFQPRMICVKQPTPVALYYKDYLNQNGPVM